MNHVQLDEQTKIHEISVHKNKVQQRQKIVKTLVWDCSTRM